MSSPARTRTSLYSRLQPARFPGPAGPLSENFQTSGSGAERKAILSLPAPALRYGLPGCVPRNRVRGWRLERLRSLETNPGDLWFFPSLERTQNEAFRYSAWPVPYCLARGRMRAAKDRPYTETRSPFVGAAFRRPPHPNHPLRLVATGALSWSSRTTFRKPLDQRQRRGNEDDPITARAGVAVQSPGSVPRNGVRSWRLERWRSSEPNPGASLVPFWANRKEHPRSRKAPRTPTF